MLVNPQGVKESLGVHGRPNPVDTTMVNSLAKRLSLLLLVLWACIACSDPNIVSFKSVPSTLVPREMAVTTLGVDYSGVVLASQAGFGAPATTIAFSKGDVSVSGVVNGPKGAVAFASVRMERLVGTQVASATVSADKDGRYSFSKVSGGRVRIRAWRSPDLTMDRQIITFAAGTLPLDISVETFGTTKFQWSLDPSPPRVGQDHTLTVGVKSEQVDNNGILRTASVAGVTLQVASQGALVVGESGTQTVLTNSTGRATLPAHCMAEGGSDILIRTQSGTEGIIHPPSCQEIQETTLETTTEPILTTIARVTAIMAVSTSPTSPTLAPVLPPVIVSPRTATTGIPTTGTAAPAAPQATTKTTLAANTTVAEQATVPAVVGATSGPTTGMIPNSTQAP